ncbi:hypothetical protein KIH39_00005 [Telmatocola sphagniphila]|uniref:Uncharacterized protein n=1 Tax=Telmatocola sphagniphila TaxID=1123043 RepID=A0A8E6B5M5_9BACT|nr:hypothetical protein [Telmatocola sphagniphila]QVL32337.1 hypothetical protein KIH39_00005 [Telmatocola sphagniphila]
MSTTKPKIQLQESLGLSSGADAGKRVDREAGIIYDVRVLGPKSPNCHGVRGVSEGTLYTRKAMEGYVKLLEGMEVNVHHLQKKELGRDRNLDEGIATLRSVRIVDSQEGPTIRSNMHYSKVHAFTPLLLESCERDDLPRIGLSHHAYPGEYEVKDRQLVIQSITYAESVDLVRKPATNHTLFESERKQVAVITLKSLLESQRKRLLAAGKKKPLTVLLEDIGDEVMATPVEDVPEDADEALDAGIAASCYAVIDSIIDGETEVEEGLGKLRQLLESHEELTGEGGGDGGDDNDEGDKKTVTESVKRKGSENARLALLEAKEKVREMLDENGVTATPTLVESIASLSTDAARKKAIEDLKTMQGSGSGRPRSRAPGGLSLKESKKTPKPGDILRQLRGG